MDIRISTEDIEPSPRLHASDDPIVYRCGCGYRWGHDGIDKCFAYFHDRIATLEKMLNVKRED